MNNKRSFVRTTVSAGLAVLLLVLNVAIPALESAESFGPVGIESAHDAGRCGDGHDHRICTQVGANLSLSASTYDHRTTHVTLRSALPVDPASTIHRTFLEGPPSRAPPLA
jgi:hypothetical protein